MRKLTVTLASIALAALALAPEAALTPYADVAHAVLPKAIAAAAFLLLLAIIADRPKAEPTRIAAEAVNLAAPVPTANQAGAEVVNFLAILQEKGRLVDFLRSSPALRTQAGGLSAWLLLPSVLSIKTRKSGPKP